MPCGPRIDPGLPPVVPTRDGMVITPAHTAAFTALSHDRNPIHWDADYARHTPFGGVLAHGMTAVLLAVGEWAQGRRLRFTEIRATFIKPVHHGVAYALRCVERTPGRVRIEWLRGPVVQGWCGFRWVAAEEEEEEGGGPASPAWFQPRSAAADRPLAVALADWRGRDFAYAPAAEPLAECLRVLGWQPCQLPRRQLEALLAASYFAGMELPGRQALFYGFEFEFTPAPAGPPAAGFAFTALEPEWDDRINRLAVTGAGTGLARVELTALLRPGPVLYSSAEIRAAVGLADDLRDRVILVTGAGRGLGAVLAEALAARGALVVRHRRTVAPGADGVAGELRDAGECRRMADEIRARWGRLDALVLNAFPGAPGWSFGEATSGEWLAYLGAGLATAAVPLGEFLPLVPPGGMVLGVGALAGVEPGAVPPPLRAAKGALESLLQGVAAEHPDRRFVVVRAPRMLTDQNNAAFDFSPPVSAVPVACRIVSVLAGPGESDAGNWSVVGGED